MDKIDKNLLKMPKEQREALLADFEKVQAGQLHGLNIKKMKGHKDLYRLRNGIYRLIYMQQSGQSPIIKYIGKRDGQTYRDF